MLPHRVRVLAPQRLVVLDAMHEVARRWVALKPREDATEILAETLRCLLHLDRVQRGRLDVDERRHPELHSRQHLATGNVVVDDAPREPLLRDLLLVDGLLERAMAHEPIHGHGLALAVAVRAEEGLLVVHGVPKNVRDDDARRRRQGDAHAAGLRGDEENGVHVGDIRLEALDHLCAHDRRRVAIQVQRLRDAHVLDQHPFDCLQHRYGLGEDEHLVLRAHALLDNGLDDAQLDAVGCDGLRGDVDGALNGVLVVSVVINVVLFNVHGGAAPFVRCCIAATTIITNTTIIITATTTTTVGLREES
eukprot:PhM_4_TR18031/c2_g1_i1/m.37162